jgi:hypothetical protein
MHFHNRSAITKEISPIKRDVVTLLVDFIMFKNSKTAINLGNWMHDTATSKGISPEMVHSNNVDGGALAAGKMYDTITSEGCTNEIETIHCNFHCVALSSKEGLGLNKGKTNHNPAMGKCLKRCHTLLSKMLRKSNFMKAYRKVQDAKNRSPRISCNHC